MQLLLFPTAEQETALKLKNLDLAVEQTAIELGAGVVERYLQVPDGPVLYVKEILGIHEIRPYQERALRALSEHRRVCMRGPHGIGKTALESWVVLWALSVFKEIKAPTTASAWRQLTEFLWPEIHKWAANAKWDRLGLVVRRDRELLRLRLQLDDNRFAFAIASSDEAKIEGAHSAVIAYGFDEAKAIPDEIWDAAEGAFSTGVGYALAISTPGAPAGRFYDIQARKKGYEDWHVIHVSEEEAREHVPGFAEWADARARQWGKESAIYQNRVAGNFAQSDEDSVIPLAWIEAAMARWTSDGQPDAVPPTIGADIARMGEDKTVFAKRYGNWFAPMLRYSKMDTMEVSGLLGVQLAATGARANIDVIGIGSGVYDRLKEQGKSVFAINVSRSSHARDKTGQFGFVNLRSALMWGLRERLDPESGDDIAIPPDDKIVGDLTAPTWVLTSGGKIKVESKNEIKKRLGRSPDDGDALMLAFAGGEAVSAEVMRSISEPDKSRFVAEAPQGSRWSRGKKTSWRR